MARENDVVLVYLEDSPVSFARVESIEPDSKKDWYQIKLLMLQIPVQVVTWILKDLYINGEEFFMGGKRMRLEVVECPDDEEIIAGLDAPEDDGQEEAPLEEEAPEEEAPKEEVPKEAPSKGGGKIISFAEVKRQKQNNGPETS
ncbi:MAG: hypothetical protein GY737_01845 [Desulfobacteraceae bacterium]|nr:hypothetical protein [Desulfobacteraceae bacterium]